MSIVDFNNSYSGSDSCGGLTGKFFWFSGIDLKKAESALREQNQRKTDSPQDGRYFKLHRSNSEESEKSAPDNYDADDNDVSRVENTSGRWFGFSVYSFRNEIPPRLKPPENQPTNLKAGITKRNHQFVEVPSMVDEPVSYAPTPIEKRDNFAKSQKVFDDEPDSPADNEKMLPHYYDQEPICEDQESATELTIDFDEIDNLISASLKDLPLNESLSPKSKTNNLHDKNNKLDKDRPSYLIHDNKPTNFVIDDDVNLTVEAEQFQSGPSYEPSLEIQGVENISILNEITATQEEVVDHILDSELFRLTNYSAKDESLPADSQHYDFQNDLDTLGMLNDVLKATAPLESTSTVPKSEESFDEVFKKYTKPVKTAAPKEDSVPYNFNSFLPPVMSRQELFEVVTTGNDEMFITTATGKNLSESPTSTQDDLYVDQRETAPAETSVKSKTLPRTRVSVSSKNNKITVKANNVNVKSSDLSGAERKKKFSIVRAKSSDTIEVQRSNSTKINIRSKSVDRTTVRSKSVGQAITRSAPNSPGLAIRMTNVRNPASTAPNSPGTLIRSTPRKTTTRKMEELSSAKKWCDLSSSEDEDNSPPQQNNFSRGTSFRRSIVIDDTNNTNYARRQSAGGTCVSINYIVPTSPLKRPVENNLCTQLKRLLIHLENMQVEEELFAEHFEVVRELNSMFWRLKDESTDVLSLALNFLVTNEWPKIVVQCSRKLMNAYPHVFKAYTDDPLRTIYYSGHLPSVLRLNRTSAEYAVAVLFDGLLKAAINYTDIHEASRQASCEQNLTTFLFENIVPQLYNIKWGKSTAREAFLKSICDLVYNCAQSTSNVPLLIKDGAVQLFTGLREETFGESDAQKTDMTMLLILSYLIDRDSQDAIDERSIIRLLQFLDKALEHSEHTVDDYFVAELSDCLTRLSALQNYRELVTQNSGQELLHKLLRQAYDNEERISGCTALWSIAFSKQAKDVIRNMGKLMNLLHKLKESENGELRHAASGVIWECVEKYDLKGIRDGRSVKNSHVMISYEFQSQPLVIKIRDHLHEAGYTVWMNTDGEERSLQERMRRGVERAWVVIAAVSRKYQQTPSACTELDYAHVLRKPIVPILLESDCKLEGWVEGCVENYGIDFHVDTLFKVNMKSLIERIDNLIRGQPTQDKTKDSPERSRNRSTDISKWSNDDVIEWLLENNLIKLVNGVGSRLLKFTGLHLLMLFDLKTQTPDYYYSMLDAHLGLNDVLDTLEFTYALDRLLSNERLI